MVEFQQLALDFIIANRAESPRVLEMGKFRRMNHSFVSLGFPIESIFFVTAQPCATETNVV